jgi:hypothetical protein
MPTSILGEVDDLFDGAEPNGRERPPECASSFTRPAEGGPAPCRALSLQCPACGSSHVAQVLGDNGGISYACTACGHSWS